MSVWFSKVSSVSGAMASRVSDTLKLGLYGFGAYAGMSEMPMQPQAMTEQTSYHASVPAHVLQKQALTDAVKDLSNALRKTDEMRQKSDRRQQGGDIILVTGTLPPDGPSPQSFGLKKQSKLTLT